MESNMKGRKQPINEASKESMEAGRQAG